ncbi:MAG TPA: amidohydrolase family protein [Trebonia sp.]|jgi:5-methylthioadenosine/S-adenosylhomocysteine deaminase|nr:amidohydrolase family protein [Trebonia sp.]
MTALTVVNALLLTMADGQDPFHGWLTVGEDGRITGIGPGQPPAGAGGGTGRAAGEVLDARGRIVAPGFVSAHSHLHTSGMRGIAADEQLYPWVRACVRLAMGADPDDMYWFALHGCLDFLASGITSAFNFPQSEVLSLYDPATGSGPPVRKDETFLTRQFDAIADSGLRVMGAIRLDDEPGGQGPDDARVHERFDRLAAAQADRIPAAQHLGTAVYGAVQWSAGPRTARLEAEVMARHRIVNQAHFLETSEDLDAQRRKFAWYADAGVLGETMIFGHFVHPTDDIVAAVAASGARVCWQPTSNGRLGSGVADIVRYRRAGILVGVGLDDQSCTDVSDPFANMRLGMYAQRARYTDPSVLTAREMLRLHTLGSAEVLGVADRVGSLAPGRYADFLVVDPARPDTGPMWDPYATYVQACGLRNLDEVRVGGRLVSSRGGSENPLSATAAGELHARVIASARRAGITPPVSPLCRRAAAGGVPGGKRPAGKAGR